MQSYVEALRTDMAAAGVASLGPIRREQPWIIVQKHGLPIAGAKLFQEYALTFDQRRQLLRFEKIAPSCGG